MVQAQPTPDVGATTAAIAADRLRKVIDDRVILDDLTFTIPSGAFVALLGANGAGKSTLMRICSMLLPPTSGDISLFGHSLRSGNTSLRRRIGLVSHQAMLYRDLSPRENLRLFGRLYGVPRADERAMQLLELMNLADRRDDPVKSFSRGMTQRTAIARALMHDPDLILADEPFAGLDAPSVHNIEMILCALNRAGHTILLANHDIHQSLRLVNHVLLLRRGKLAMDRAAAGLTADEALKEISH